MKKLLLIPVVLLLGSISFGANDCSKITLDSTFKTKAKAEKQTILETKIWQDVKRNEIPELDLNLVTAEEMTQAYANLSNKKNARTKANLFDGLRDKAVSEGVTCI